MRMVSVMGLAVIVNAGVIGARAPRVGQPARPATVERTYPVPMSLVQEHALFITELNAAASLPGQTGAAARRVLTRVTPHFRDEQRRVHPLLYVLPMLAAHQAEPWMADLVPIAERLHGDLDDIRRAHLSIDAALDDLYAAAWREHHQDYAFLAMRIRRHEQLEEEINYPAALIVGEALQLRFPTATARRES
jgi:hypothetical protein